MKSMMISTLVLPVVLTLALPVNAQTTGGKSSASQSQEQMTKTMQEMAGRMNSMSQQMAGGGMTAEHQAQMARQLKNRVRATR
jgi:hypothetical protein